MLTPSFVGYIGEPDLHDGTVVAVESHNDHIRVRVRGASGKEFVVEFRGVRALRANRPEGMPLYALSELSGSPPVRRFAFANWDETDEAFLEVDAETVDVREQSDQHRAKTTELG